MVRPVIKPHDERTPRYTGGRLAAAFLMMLAMAGAMITFLDDAEIAHPDWPLPIVAAAVIGAMAGWSQLGRNLGGDFYASGMFGLGAACVGLVFFALVYGFRSAYITHVGVQFDAAIDVITHILETGINVLRAFAASPRTVAALALGAAISGVIAEYCNRIWK